jgi:hypothetical protein
VGGRRRLPANYLKFLERRNGLLLAHLKTISSQKGAYGHQLVASGSQ